MSAEVQLLFDDEIPPEKMEAVGKSRARKKKEAPPSSSPGQEDPSSSSQLLHGWKPEKQYYSIGEVAALFSMNTSHIRYWTQEFSLRVRTTRKGDRMYTPDQILEIKKIYELVRERGYTLAGAKARLKTDRMLHNETIDLKQSLIQLRARLVTIRNQLG